jgi:hypothetical protein
MTSSCFSKAKCPPRPNSLAVQSYCASFLRSFFTIGIGFIRCPRYSEVFAVCPGVFTHTRMPAVPRFAERSCILISSTPQLETSERSAVKGKKKGNQERSLYAHISLDVSRGISLSWGSAFLLHQCAFFLVPSVFPVAFCSAVGGLANPFQA